VTAGELFLEGDGGMPVIAAFDVATATGVCQGVPGGVPAVWTWHLSDGGKSRAYRLCYLRRLCDKYFHSTEIDAVYYEEPVNLRVMMKIGATDETIALLRGAVGVLEACAIHAGIQTVEAVPVQKARRALTGQGTYSRIQGKSMAKEAVMRTVKMLGVEAKNDNEADSYAVWFYACALHNPRLAHLSQPLFLGRT
jgi:hypothetical protein